jgi:serine/threonine protein kinase/Tol biopolymer transport system component
MDLEKGTLLHGRYKIQDTLGKGGMGAVYHALDESLGVYVAVKENLIEDEEGLKQFRREATLLAGLRHQNLPRVTDHFVIEGQGQYLVMDFIAGEDLKQRFQRTGRFHEKEVLTIGIAICDALNYLHSLRPPVLHRDIKPGNIRITPSGHVYLVDFGLAKIVKGTQATTTGARGLTPGYSPPEQYGTARTDARSDIYALGATLYSMLIGSPPADGLAVAIGQTKVTPVQTLNPKASPEIAAALEKALSVDPEDRYQTAAEFKRALRAASETVDRRIAAGELTVAPPPVEALDPTMVSAGPTIPSADGLSTVEDEVTPPGKKRTWIGFVIGFVVIAALAAVGIVFGPQLFSAAPTPTPTATEDSAISTDSNEEVAPASTLTFTPTLTLEPSLTPTATVTSTPLPTPQGGGAQIAFASNRTGEVQVWLLTLSDGELFQITDIRGGACQPTWSPDGQQLVFVAPCSRNQQTYPGSSLFIINADGSNMNPLPSSPIGDFDPDWSPVDNQILFTTLRDFNRAQVWILDIDTGESYNVSNNVASDSQATWSPDGELIAFVSTRVINRGQIWLMDTQGENVFEFSRSSTRTNLEPAWSPDGELIVYTQFGIRGGGTPNLMGAFWDEGDAMSGTNEFRITDDPSEMRETDFSPDGRWITFAANSDYADLEIFLMRVNGSEITQLTTDDAEDFDPAWRPTVP